MRELITIIIVVLLATGQAFSQIHFGATTAVNSTFVLDKGLSEDPRYNSDFTYEFAPVGFVFGVDIGKKFGLQLESILAKQGQVFEVVDAAKNAVGERKIDLSVLQMPLFMKFMSGKSSGARTNFSLGPQLSLIRKGVETLQYGASDLTFPEGTLIEQQPDGTYNITDATGVNITGAVLNADGTYSVPELPSTELLSSEAQNAINRFKEAEFQIAASFGVDIDLGKHLYLSSIIRANYSLTDMRNGDFVDSLKDGGVGSIFERRANLAVGIQLGLNYVIGGTRTFKAKNSVEESD